MPRAPQLLPQRKTSLLSYVFFTFPERTCYSFGFVAMFQQLAEALLTLANITVDENKREELYSRAQAELGESLHLDVYGSGTVSDNGDAMDES